MSNEMNAAEAAEYIDDGLQEFGDMLDKEAVDAYSLAASITRKYANGELVEVVHAHWWDINGDGKEYVCSKCGIPAAWTNPHIKKQIKSDYCPSCGAKMDGGSNHETD